MKKDTIKKLLVSTWVILLMTSHALTQNSVRQAFSSGQFEECLVLCEALLKDDPTNGQAWFFKGASLVRLKKYQQAEEPLKKAIENEFPANPAHANLLRSYAGQNRVDDFFTLLKAVPGSGFANYAFFNNCEEFEPYRHHEVFKEAYEQIYANAFPCKSQNDTQRLDFWLGEWDIYNPASGARVASSRITKSKDGCTLYEDYEHQSGFFGRSMNYYDPSDSLYKQVWIDLRNNISNYVETASGVGLLIMQADLGNGSLTRTTWTYKREDDTVLQAAENSNDNGQSWTPGFVGLYKRKIADLGLQLKSKLSEMETLFKANQMRDIAGFYTEDAQLMEPGGGMYAGIDAIEDYWSTFDGRGVSWKLEVIEAYEAGDLAYSVVSSDLTYTDEGKVAEAKLRALLIWEKTSQGYLIKKDFFHIVR